MPSKPPAPAEPDDRQPGPLIQPQPPGPGELPPPGSPLPEGAVLEQRYRVIRLLGQGGFATVYQAWDEHLQRACAIKENQLTTPEAQRQFEREARLLADLRHPNLPRVTDHFLVPGRGQYLVMDYVAGENLHHLLERHGRPFDQATALGWVLPVLDALSYLHSQQPPIIHRDVKPQNIILAPNGHPFLVDFGIAKAYTPQAATTIGARAVSPGYSPPEQYGQSNTDPRSDLYSLGATLYTLLTARIPPDSVDVMSGSQPPPAAVQALNPSVSPHVAAAISAAMQPSRLQRFPSMEAFRQALTHPASAPPAAGLVQPVTRPEPAPGSHPRGAARAAGAPPRPVQPARPAPASQPPSGGPFTRPRGAAGPGLLVLGVIGLLGLIGLGTIFWLLQPDSRPPAAPGSPGSPAPLSSPALPTPRPGGALGPTLPPSPTAASALPGASPAAQEASPEPPTPAPATPVLRGSDDVPMVQLPAGAFKMGMTNPVAMWNVELCSQFGSCSMVDYEDAMPQHTVSLDAFRLDIHEVTFRQYNRCVAAGACPAPVTGGLEQLLPGFDSQKAAFGEYPVVGFAGQAFPDPMAVGQGRIPG
ncbi:MAG: protein kinase domain-containing protein, partial [Chloroflexota bacterium]